ncbi:MAG TPA: rhomboid family intramembrane serine protease [Acidiferrobacterales bacterium]|nr:rhomboid family intramembrane serine protease [Acidiferrobacterales bacterium]
MIPLRDDNPTTLKPVITIGLIALCTLVFFWQLSLGAHAEAMIQALGVIPAALFGSQSLPPELRQVPAALTVVTSMFLHGGWMHLIGNMLYLWIFGNNVEDAMGHGRFVLFYLLCGVAAVLVQAIPAPDSTIPMIGASGAISGVLGAYLLLYPHARVLVLIPLGYFSRMLYLPAMVVLGFWFLLQLLSTLLADPNQPGVAFGAHAGGFVAGMLLIPLFKRREIRLLHPRQLR